MIRRITCTPERGREIEQSFNALDWKIVYNSPARMLSDLIIFWLSRARRMITHFASNNMPNIECAIRSRQSFFTSAYWAKPVTNAAISKNFCSCDAEATLAS